MTSWTVKTRKKFNRLSLTWFMRGMLFVSQLFPYNLGVWLGGLLGYLAYYILPRDRKRAILHLTWVFGDKGQAWIRRTAHRCFVHLGKSMLETMLLDSGRLSRVVEFKGHEKLRRALEQGRGAVYFTGHIGNWEIMAAAVAEKFPLSVIAAPLEPEQLNDMIVRLRAAKGVRTILRTRPGASRELIRIFRENRILGLLIDQDTEVDGAFVDFMGKPAWTPTAAASIATRAGIPLTPRRRHHHHRPRTVPYASDSQSELILGARRQRASAPPATPPRGARRSPRQRPRHPVSNRSPPNCRGQDVRRGRPAPPDVPGAYAAAS